MRALQLPGEELQADVAHLQLLGEHGEFDAAAESFVFVDDEGDADAGGADLAGELDGGLQFGPLGGAGPGLRTQQATERDVNYQGWLTRNPSRVGSTMSTSSMMSATLRRSSPKASSHHMSSLVVDRSTS